MSDLQVAKMLSDCVFDLLPQVFTGDPSAAVERLQASEFRPARDSAGRAMMARRAGDLTLCIIASPSQPLPRLNLVGPGAADVLGPIADEIIQRGFDLAQSSPDRDGREIRTYSATTEGRIMAVTLVRPLTTDNLLSVVVVPPVRPARPAGEKAQS